MKWTRTFASLVLFFRGSLFPSPPSAAAPPSAPPSSTRRPRRRPPHLPHPPTLQHRSLSPCRQHRPPQRRLQSRRHRRKSRPSRQRQRTHGPQRRLLPKSPGTSSTEKPLPSLIRNPRDILGVPHPYERPTQFSTTLYHANNDQVAKANAEVAALGQKVDTLLARRRQLDAEQSALWATISWESLPKPRYLSQSPLPFPTQSQNFHLCHRRALRSSPPRHSLSPHHR